MVENCLHHLRISNYWAVRWAVGIVPAILPCHFEGDVKERRLIFEKIRGRRFGWCGLSPIEWGKLSPARNNYPYAVAITLGSMNRPAPFGRTRERQKSSLRSPRQEYARSVETLDNILTGGNDSKTSTGSRPPGPSLFWRSSWKKIKHNNVHLKRCWDQSFTWLNEKNLQKLSKIL